MKKPINLTLFFIIMISGTMLLSILFGSQNIHIKSTVMYIVFMFSFLFSSLVFFLDFSKHLIVQKSQKNWSKKDQYTIYWSVQKTYWENKFEAEGKNILSQTPKQMLGYKFLVFFLSSGFFVTLFFAIISVLINTQERTSMDFEQKVTRSFYVKGCSQKIHLYEDFRGESFTYCLSRTNISLPATLHFSIGFHALGMKVESIKAVN